jgi:hypothetical protein
MLSPAGLNSCAEHIAYVMTQCGWQILLLLDERAHCLKTDGELCCSAAPCCSLLNKRPTGDTGVEPNSHRGSGIPAKQHLCHRPAYAMCMYVERMVGLVECSARSAEEYLIAICRSCEKKVGLIRCV